MDKILNELCCNGLNIFDQDKSLLKFSFKTYDASAEGQSN